MSPDVPQCPQKKKSFPRRKRWAAAQLARGVSQKMVAHELKTHRKTIQRWCADPQFQAEIQAEVDDLRASFAPRLNRLVDRSLKALDIQLEACLRDERNSAKIALHILDLIGRQNPFAEPSGTQPASALESKNKGL